MKKYFLLGIALLGTILLTACANCFQSQSNLLTECWMRQVDTSPAKWKQYTDYSFLTNEPHQIARRDHGTCSKAITTMHVPVCDFTTIQVNAPFKVQLYSTEDDNSVSILGPNQQVRQVIAEVRNGTLYLHQDEKSKIPLNRVIVQVSIHHLSHLTNNGPCPIEGDNLVIRDPLMINSNSRGDILLTGNINLAQVNQMGTGTITVKGAVTSTLAINVIGNGNLNISGNMDVQSIIHHGNGRINMIGVNTNCLQIHATGHGFTGIFGHVNLKQITALNYSCVYVYWVDSDDTRIFIHDNARVGLAGLTKNLTINTFNSARFEGSYLKSQNVYIRTYNSSHANVAPDQKLFASALDNSSIYYMGSPPNISQYPSQNATILSIPNSFHQPYFKRPIRTKKLALKGERTYRPAYK